MKRFIYALIIQLCLFSLAFSGTTGKVAGRVIDAVTKEPIAGANIILEGTMRGASTDVDGEYYIINIPVGRYTVIVSYVGYQSIKHPNVKILLDQTTKLNFQLSEDISESETILVTAETFKVQKDEVSKKITIQSEDIQAMPVQDFSELVTAQAGIVQIESSVRGISGFEDRGIEEIHVRGGRSGEIGYTIDGMYITNPFCGHKYSWTQLNDFALEQVDIKTGVFDAEYGGAISSMINMITRDGGDKLEGNIRIRTSNPGRLFNPTTFFSKDKSAPFDVGFEQDYLRDNRLISGGFGGPVPFTNNRLKFIVTGHKQRSSYGVWQFDNETFNTADPYNLENEFVNQLDTIAGWRAMGFRTGWDLYSKLSWRINNSMKLDLSVWNLETIFRTMNLANFGYLYYEEGRNIDTQTSDRQALMFNHQISKNVFYDLRFSRFYQKMFIGVTDNGQEDGRYLDPDEYIAPETDIENYEFNPFWYEFVVSGHDRYYHKNYAETYEGFANILAQATKHHQLKMGGSYRRHTIMIDEIQLPWLLTPYKEKYKKHPEEAAAYIQDLIEYDYMTIHLGLRLDMFNSNHEYWDDPYAVDKKLVKSQWKYHLSPRLGFSHVITDNATFTFGYGKFTQLPTYRNQYINEERDIKTYSPIVGNSGLSMEDMTAYEFGVNVGVDDNTIVQVIGWSKEYSNLTSTERIPQFPYSYTTFLNTDYATARGMDIVVRRQVPGKYSAVLQYTYSRATANRPDPWEGYRATQTTRTMPKREILMGYDRSHDISLMLSYQINKNEGPSLFGFFPFERTRLNVMSMALSGWPYTPVIGNIAGETNSERGPWSFTTNFNLRRYFNVYGVDMIFGVMVQNVFDRKNEIDIWPATGTASDPGLRLNRLIEMGIYSKTMFDRPFMYGRRRQIDFSLEIAF